MPLIDASRIWSRSRKSERVTISNCSRGLRRLGQPMIAPRGTYESRQTVTTLTKTILRGIALAKCRSHDVLFVHEQLDGR